MHENINNSEIETPKQKNSFLRIALYILLGLVFFVIIFFLILYLFKYNIGDDEEVIYEQGRETIDVKQDTSRDEVFDKDLSLVENKLFYSENNNLFSYDIDTHERIKWTDFKKKDNASLTVSNVMDNNEVFFDFSDGEGTKKLYRINLETKEKKEIKNFGKDVPFTAGVLDVHSENKFVYQLHYHYEEEVTRDYNWSLVLFENGNERTLSVGDGGGRHDSFVDSSEAQFSEDGNYLFYIGTMVYQQDKEMYGTFQISVYDLNSDTEKIIVDATHPTWLDNENIVYVSLENPSFMKPKTEAFYLYNVKTGTTEKLIDLGELAGKGIIYGESLIYINQPKEIWRYNFQTEENTNVYTNVSELVKMISNVYKITDNKLIYSTQQTTGVPMPDYTVNLLNLETNEEKELEIHPYFRYLK